ncbi:MAG: serine/threonine-protein kinase, partial [Bryobacteraceae bacterium]
MTGRTLGRYRILDQLGAGGFGVVYRARDDSLQRDVAVKLLPAGSLAGESERKRFRQEALALSQLNHPNICTIFEVGEEGGQAYIAMEYIEGQPLSRLIASGGLPVDTAIRYGARIADALAHAHDRDLVHRDLKSSNVMVTPEGRVKVLDFGVARRVAPEDQAGTPTPGSTITVPGEVAGTMSY